MSQRNLKNKGDIEVEIRQAVIRFEKEFMGRGPLETRAYLLEDGRQLVKQMRCKLLEKGRPLLEAVIRDIVGIAVQSIHTDISTRTGERVIVFRLQEELPGDLGGRPNPRLRLAGRNGGSAGEGRRTAPSS